MFAIARRNGNMNEPTDLFDPAHYARVRLPVLEAGTLPPWCYTSQAFYDREIERIFRRSWNFIGRADEIAEPGDYFTIELAGESIIVLRDQARQVRAFLNICRHRGTRLIDGKGNCRAISCPYHSWTYGLNGDLIGSAGMEKTLNFDRACYGLMPVRLESWAGFLFASFDGQAPGLAGYLGDLPRRFEAYNFSDMVCVRRKEYDLACNWKVYLENAMEEYHTPTVHRKSIGSQKTDLVDDGIGAWDAIFMPAPRTIAVLAEDSMSAFPPIAGLHGRPAEGTYFTAIYPSTFFATTQDCMWWLQELPRGPGHTRIVIGSCFPRATVARSDFRANVEKYFKRWDKSLPEDNAISERQQTGLASSYGRPGRLSWHEPVVHRIANWVLDRVLDGDARTH
jgi:phenylpropionate dioxygenase-like ring-hydroxylating dioxygenase large terminal subunit